MSGTRLFKVPIDYLGVHAGGGGQNLQRRRNYFDHDGQGPSDLHRRAPNQADASAVRRIEAKGILLQPLQRPAGSVSAIQGVVLATFESLRLSDRDCGLITVIQVIWWFAYGERDMFHRDRSSRHNPGGS